MGIKKFVRKIADKAASDVSKLATLSSEELDKINQKRDSYLFDMPDLTDEASVELTNRLLAASAVEIYNAYLPQIDKIYSPLDSKVEYNQEFLAGHNTRYINITKWVTNKEENSLEKLTNVYEVLSKDNCNIGLVFERKINTTNVYLAITNIDNQPFNTNSDDYIKRLVDALKGNFPGSEYNNIEIGKLPCLDNERSYSIASASNIPAEKSDKFISQTIEKLIDGIIPMNSKQEYTIILLATPIQDIEERKTRLSELYTALSPYSGWQTNYTFTQVDSFGSQATVGVNIGASAGTQASQNQATSESDTATDSTSSSESEGNTTTETRGTSTTDGTNVSGTVGYSSNTTVNGGGSVGVVSGSVSQEVGTNVSTTVGKSWAKTASQSTAKAVTKTIANTIGKAVSKGVSKTVGSTIGKSFGLNFGANFARASTVTATVGKNEGITQSYINYTIRHTLEILEEQMKRYEESVALGMWDFAAYVLSEDVNVANNVAHTYVALTQGEKSYMSQASINLWRGDEEDSEAAKEICDYLRDLRHPIFGLNPDVINIDPSYLVYPTTTNLTIGLSGKELAYSLNFPRKSITGLPVLECAEFGRNISTYNENLKEDTLNLGNIFHMNTKELTEIDLNINSLASHTFITGSTGTGKSTTVYRILNEAKKKGVNFLVIEPAKGEYKNVFGNRKDVFVYGTNPKITELLKLNPFSFNKKIHVLEHIDRLTEIFNVCWPMYAAMPAVLKNAIEKSYIDCGWDLIESTNEFYDNAYPTFKDVARNIKNIINESEYDNENKGAYKGSLLTRLESLTTGLNGMIFSKNELSETDLFDRNVIIDLSRIGSMETKSLFMGLLVLKLQEYRLSSSGINEKLKHITVLEEAHNLLKRTSFEQSSESSNLIGKSVEMLSNAIAEMRTYGEGFIIADQAPGLLDMSVIRNTNTKIIMRLPDEGDRELVGLSANLNQQQIIELAKIPRGVAAIYQNEWIEPVLCKVKKVNNPEGEFEFIPSSNDNDIIDAESRDSLVTLLCESDFINNKNIVNDIKKYLDRLNVDDFIKISILRYLNKTTPNVEIIKLSPIISNLYPTASDAIVISYKDSKNPSKWTNSVQDRLILDNINLSTRVIKMVVQAIITNYVLLEKNNLNDLQRWQEQGVR